MASSEAFLQQNFSEADEERAMRSIVVSNLPQTNDKDLIIHFQKSANGGKDVDAVFFPNPDDSSTAVVTFDDPSTVESVLEHKQIFEGRALTVQRYPVAQQQPPFEVFSTVKARLNTEVIDCTPRAAERLIDALKNKIPGIKWEHRSDSRIFIKGSYDDIKKCHSFLQEYVQEHHTYEESCDEQMEKMLVSEQGAHSNHRSFDQNPSYGSPMLEDQGSHRDRQVQPQVFKTTPLICQFTSVVPKYQRQLDIIIQEFLVDIQVQKGNGEVAIIPKHNCTQEKFDEACEELTRLFQEVAQVSRHRDFVNQGSGSTLTSPKEIICEVMKSLPVLAVENRPGEIGLYGKEEEVELAKKMVKAMEGAIKRERRDIPTCAKTADRADTTATRKAEVNPGHEMVASSTGMASLDKYPLSEDEDKAVFITKKGFKISVYKGDITDEDADAIVNIVDESLSCFTGLARAIVGKGGETISSELFKMKQRRKPVQGDVLVTNSGTLVCKKVFHAVAPVKMSKERSKKLLRQIVNFCLDSSEKDFYTSIAFPAIGTGVIGISIDICASAMVSSLEEHMKKGRNYVRDIRFVHCDPRAVEVFKSELMKRYSSALVQSTPRHSQTTDGDQGSSSATEDAAGLTGKHDPTEDDVCPICLDVFNNPISLPLCGHKYCKSCIDEAFKTKKSCPTCGLSYGVHQGNMPHGTMADRIDRRQSLPGYPGCDAIVITYHFPSGTQGREHPNPGGYYCGTTRMAYLPNNPEGREVLSLLRKAFYARLTFTIGTSVTTGQTDVVTWNDIHHKTNPYGGASGFGYPDPTYLSRVKEELAAKGIR